MSRVRQMLIALGMAFALPALPGAAQGTATPVSTRSPLAGTWQSRPDETPLSAPYQEAVWGKNAKEVRTVRMVVQPTGDATITVNRRVVDGQGRTVKGSASVEEANIHLGGVQADNGIRTDLAVTVKKAERRYPDDKDDPWPLDGLRVMATTFPDDARRVEVRFEFPDGRGSFWDTLRRGAATPAARKAPTT